MAASYAAREHYPLERELGRFAELVRAGGLVLDVGCGPAQYARALEARGLRAIGLDLSGQMLAQAQLAGSRSLLLADMVHIPLPSDSVDGLFVCASLLHLPHHTAPSALIEFRRVLRRYGILYLALKEGEGEEWLDSEFGERLFAYYSAERVDGMVMASGFALLDGWINPPQANQHHNWINRFAAAL
jgi:ubiquinone/menaquinone biosynthesis C-methylase UbiE